MALGDSYTRRKVDPLPEIQLRHSDGEIHVEVLNGADLEVLTKKSRDCRMGKRCSWFG